MKISQALLLLSLQIIVPDAGATSLDKYFSITCQIDDKNLYLSYCVFVPLGPRSPDVIYYFHKKGGGPMDWLEDWTSPVVEQWLAKNTPIPVVVAPTYGSFWLLVEANQSKVSGYMEEFKDYLVPKVEAQLGPVRHRMAVGVSMGGFSAASLALKHPNLFARVALGSPSIASISPYSPDSEIDAYIERTGASRLRIWAALRKSEKYFAKPSDWKKNSPLELVHLRPAAQLPDFNISVGDRDEFGFFEGSQTLASELQRAGGNVEWSLLGGEHGTLDVHSIANFLTRP
jgi:enterochelin esterase-like enzyme